MVFPTHFTPVNVFRGGTNYDILMSQKAHRWLPLKIILTHPSKYTLPHLMEACILNLRVWKHKTAQK